MNTEKTAPPVRNWKQGEFASSREMLRVQALATASQSPVVALTTNVQVSKAIAG